MKRNPYLWQCAGALFLIALTAACGGPITSITPGAPSSAGQATSAATVAAGAGRPTMAAAPATIVSPGSQPSGGGPVSLQVTTPQDSAVVNTPQVQVSGAASPGAVVSVNDTVLIAGADGSFSTTVSLQPGPNLVEVIASSTSGDTKTVDLTVTYEQ